jgi:hypothetical protein
VSSEVRYFRVCVIDQHGRGDRHLSDVEQPPDAAGEVTFEAADGFELGLAFGVFAIQVGTGLGVSPGTRKRDDVDRAVELAVSAAVQPVALSVAAGGGDRGGAGVAGEVPVGLRTVARRRYGR